MIRVLIYLSIVPALFGIMALILVFFLNVLATLLLIPFRMSIGEYQYYCFKKRKFKDWFWVLFQDGMKGDQFYQAWKEYRDHV